MPSRSQKPPRRRTPAVAVLAFAALLGACAAQGDKFPPPCPGLSLVPDAADVSRFDGKGLDVANLVVRGRITEVPAVCKVGDKPTQVVATLHVNADFTRGPAAGGASPRVIYFIALTRADKVLREQDFTFTPSFGANVGQASVQGEEIEVLLPVSKTVSAAAYRIFVGFRLSPDELAYNRTHTRP